MTGHHEGAIAMAEDAARDGADVRVSEIAADVAAASGRDRAHGGHARGAQLQSLTASTGRPGEAGHGGR